MTEEERLIIEEINKHAVIIVELTKRLNTMMDAVSVEKATSKKLVGICGTRDGKSLRSGL